MSAPAALAMAKLSYPETEESHTKTQEDVYIENVYASCTLLRGWSRNAENKSKMADGRIFGDWFTSGSGTPI